MKLTAHTIERIAPPASGQVFHRDDTLQCFALRVTPGSKAFVVEKRIGGKVRRITLGKYPALKPETARRMAQELLGKIAAGQDPTAERRADEAARVTLAEAFTAYQTARPLKPRTLVEYRRLMATAFEDWQGKPVRAITRDMVAERFQTLTTGNGPALANLAMRMLRALFNFAQAAYRINDQPLIVENPVRRLSDTRAWNKVDRRRSTIKLHELGRWYEAARDTPAGDYLTLVLFTGLRRQEAASLRWSDIDLISKTLTVRDTKNGMPHTLPLPGFLADMLARRKELVGSSFVFPADSASGHLVDPGKARAVVTKAAGVEFTMHDLRRTFATVAESLDVPSYTIKRLLNHAGGADVTSGYIVIGVERLRQPMERIAAELCKAMKIEPGHANGNHPPPARPLRIVS